MELTKKSLGDYLEELASVRPAPAGGSAAALVGSLAAALVAMVGKVTGTKRLGEVSAEAETIRRRLESLVNEDSEAYQEFVRASSTEKETAMKRATLVPLETAQLSYRVLELADEIARTGKNIVITDAGVAALLADTAVHAASLTARMNLGSITDEEFRKLAQEKLGGLSDSAENGQAVIRYIRKQIDTGHGQHGTTI